MSEPGDRDIGAIIETIGNVSDALRALKARVDAMAPIVHRGECADGEVMDGCAPMSGASAALTDAEKVDRLHACLKSESDAHIAERDKLRAEAAVWERRAHKTERARAILEKQLEDAHITLGEREHELREAKGEVDRLVTSEVEAVRRLAAAWRALDPGRG